MLTDARDYFIGKILIKIVRDRIKILKVDDSDEFLHKISHGIPRGEHHSPSAK